MVTPPGPTEPTADGRAGGPGSGGGTPGEVADAAGGPAALARAGATGAATDWSAGLGPVDVGSGRW